MITVAEIVTNNPLVIENLNSEKYIYLEGKDFLDILTYVRDKVQMNYSILTHPLASNFLPDKTIYKTIIINKGNSLDLSSLQLIEDAIILARNSLKYRDKRIFAEDILKDLRLIDYEIIKDSINKIK